MDYGALRKTYWEKQVSRVRLLRERILARGGQVTPGRVVPDGDDLVLGTGRRLDMAVMFIDICGFSNRSAETAEEQEGMLVALNLFFSQMTRISQDYGGTVEKNTGDGLMAYFEDNAGSPPEIGCKRAVACALTMMVANSELISPILAASGFEPFEFRISIDYGKVTVANLGTARGFNSLVAIGTTANFAAKMLSKAKSNEIVIGDAVRRALPLDWQHRFAQSHPEPSGWIYLATNRPYSLFRYIGRWAGLME